MSGYTYVYDAGGNRVSKIGSAAVDTIYFGGRPLARLTAGQWTDLVYGAGGLLAEIPGTQSGSPVYRMLDHLGTAVGTLDNSGALLSSTDYAPFGEVFLGASTDPFVFTGKERDTESGNDYFGARYYASNMGRWMSPDPSGLFFADQANPQSFNLYGYVRNNPVNSIDTDGLLTIILPGTYWDSKDWNYQNPLIGEATAHFHEQHQTWLDEWTPHRDRDSDREAAAEGLRDFINNYNFAPGETLNIVTHSHGGTVALRAADLGLKHKIDILITLGAPFGYGRMSAGIGEWYNVTGSGDDVQPAASKGCWTTAGCSTQQGAHNTTVQAGSHTALWQNSDVRNLWWNWFVNQQGQTQPRPKNSCTIVVTPNGSSGDC